MAGEVAKVVGTEQITDVQDRAVVEYYLEHTLKPEDRKNIIHEKAGGKLDALKLQITALNERKISLEKFMEDMVSTMQKDALERDLNESYEDDNHVEQPGYIEQFVKLVGTKGVQSRFGSKYNDSLHSIDWDDQATFDACVKKVVDKVHSIPANVERKIRHEYVQAFIREYAEAIDNYDWFGESFDMKELEDPIKQMEKERPHFVNFDAWLKHDKNKEAKDVVYQYTKFEMSAIVYTKSALDPYKKRSAAYEDTVQKAYYDRKAAEIESGVVQNPANTKAASDMIAALDKEMAAYDTFLAFKGEIDKTRELLKQLPEPNAAFTAGVDELQKAYDAQIVSLKTAKAEDRAGILDVSKLKTATGKTNAELATEIQAAIDKNNADQKSKAAQAQAETAQDANEPDGALDILLRSKKAQDGVKQIAKQLGEMGGFALSLFFSNKALKKLGITTADFDLDKVLDKMGFGDMDPAQKEAITKKARDIFRNTFKITDVDAIAILCDEKKNVSVGDFLKKKPDHFTQPEWEKMAKTLRIKNGATEQTQGTVLAFVMGKLKDNQWKDPDPEPAAVSPATGASKPAAPPAQPASGPAASPASGPPAPPAAGAAPAVPNS